MDRTELDRKFHIAKGLVRDVGQQALRLYRDRASLGAESKGLQDFVSRADRECEDIIAETLRGLFPEDGFLGEERGRQIRRATRFGSLIQSMAQQTFCVAFHTGASRSA